MRFAAFRSSYRVSAQLFGPTAQFRQGYHSFTRLASAVPVQNLVRNSITNRLESAETNPLFATLCQSKFESIAVELASGDVDSLQVDPLGVSNILAIHSPTSWLINTTMKQSRVVKMA
jgi:hypothetical protein